MAKKKQPDGGMRQVFEDGLAANPEDVATHKAYADWLVEQGDPRGELIQVQLALEQAAPGGDLAAREAALLAEHQDEWLGEFAEHFDGREDITFSFRRGWLDEITVGRMREDLAAALARAPQLRLLRRLAVVNPDLPEMDLGQAFQQNVLAGAAWFDEEEENALVPLLESPYLGNLVSFQLGDAEHERCGVGDGPVFGLLQKMPKLEELRLFLWRLEDAESIFSMPLPRLRVLHVGGVFDYPLEALAANESLGALEELLIQAAAPDGHSKLWPDGAEALVRSPHLTGLRRLALRFLMSGDALCEPLAASGLAARLKALDLQYSGVTDEGAAVLASAAGPGRLESLDLRGNRLTEEGITRLQATGAQLVHEPQLGPEDESEEGLGLSF